MTRLFGLLVALCAAGMVLSSPSLLAVIRAARPPFSPFVLLAVQALQVLLLGALAAWAGVRFAARAGSTLPGSAPSPSAASVAHVLLGNGIAGAVFGWMFRRRGLEGAMVAHGAADVWLQAALPALLARSSAAAAPL